MYKAVIFDLDGTLLNTLEDLADSVNEMLEYFGLPQRSLDEIRQFVGNGMIKLIRRSVPEDFDESKFQAAYEFFKATYARNMCNKTKPYEGIIPCLEKLKKTGVKTFVTSNKNDDAVKGLCVEVFPKLLTEAVGVSESLSPKPDTKMIDYILKKYNLKKEECIFVGDSDTDIITAENAEMTSIGVLWGFRDKDVLLSSGADYIIEKAEEILRIVK